MIRFITVDGKRINVDHIDYYEHTPPLDAHDASKWTKVFIAAKERPLYINMYVTDFERLINQLEGA